MRLTRRSAIAQALALQIDGTANCRELGRWWTQHEIAHAAATTPQAARDAADAALELCRNCRMQTLCRARAEVDQYTGLAAGSVYVNGTAHERNTVIEPVPEAVGWA